MISDILSDSFRGNRSIRDPNTMPQYIEWEVDGLMWPRSHRPKATRQRTTQCWKIVNWNSQSFSQDSPLKR